MFNRLKVVFEYHKKKDFILMQMKSVINVIRIYFDENIEKNT